jgi:hypothetical protein
MAHFPLLLLLVNVDSGIRPLIPCLCFSRFPSFVVRLVRFQARSEDVRGCFEILFLLGIMPSVVQSSRRQSNCSLACPRPGPFNDLAVKVINLYIRHVNSIISPREIAVVNIRCGCPGGTKSSPALQIACGRRVSTIQFYFISWGPKLPPF